MLGHILPPLSCIVTMGGLRAANCLLYGCVPVYSVTGAGIECIWGYATVLEFILNSLCPSPLVILSFSVHAKEHCRGADVAFRTHPCKWHHLYNGHVPAESLFQHL